MIIRFCHRKHIFVYAATSFIALVLFYSLSLTTKENCQRIGWNLSTTALKTTDFGSEFRISFADVQKRQKWIYLPEIKTSSVQAQKPEILMLIVTRTDSFSRRNILRKTWMSNSKIIRDGRMKALFFVGMVTGNKTLKKLLLEEAESNGDMVLVDLQDTYDNLPFKTLSLLLYGKSKTPQFKIIGKIDDDVMFFPDRLIPMLDQNLIDPNSFTIYGHLSTTEELVYRNKDGPWYVSENAYNCSKYPVYVMGPFYLTTRDAAKLILTHSRFQNFMTVEDALITGILASDLGIRRKSLPMVFRYQYNNPNGKDVLAWHMAGKSDDKYLNFFNNNNNNKATLL